MTERVAAHVPERPTLDGLEAKWAQRWEEEAVYRFPGSHTRAGVYAIDTPPPTVSGSLHLGTIFGYVQVDVLARFHRMRGEAVFYPMGWDDNGLPTERRVELHFGVCCDPTLAYDPDLVVQPGASGRRAVSRPNFLALCHELTALDEQTFEHVFRTVGLSVDWSLTYATIDDRSRRVAQRAFLRNLARGEAYAAEAPTMWDVDFQTAVAQAELEDRVVPAAYHRLRFGTDDGGFVEIETTRPELLPACVALVAHPDDARFRELLGRQVTTPLFGVPVPVLAHRLADPDKGTGIAMICTFGDATDVVWWRELDLPVRAVLGRDGRFRDEVPAWLDTGPARAAYAELAGNDAVRARARIVELLDASGAVVGAPRPVEHEVKFYEKGERPLEIVTSRQWYIRNGARDDDLRRLLIDAGRALTWHPEFMRVRYEHWVEGLNTDWLISRQRYFGVPFPVWYGVDREGTVRYDPAIVPAENALPVDPQADAPPGFIESQRGQPGGFVGDPDVMDTWATSSLTPQVAGGWEDDRARFATVFPMDLRPQGPEIIRTWLFATLLRSQLEHGDLPWQHVSINGWILDPDRKKMSKSKGNVITPLALLERHGADGVRYWAAGGRAGVDTAFDEGQMKVGRRLATKILNASRFVLNLAAGASPSPATAAASPSPATAAGDGPVVLAPIDASMLAELAVVVTDVTAALAGYEWTRALERVEAFFWSFCDDYLELVKARAYDGDASATTALVRALSVQLRLLAPFLPFVTDEVWSWYHDTSVHAERWPDAPDARDGIVAGGTGEVLAVATDVIAAVRRAKSSAQVSLRAPVARVVVHDKPARLAALELAVADVARAGVVDVFTMEPAQDLHVDIELAPATS